MVVAEGLDQVHGRLEVRRGLAGIADDEIGGQREFGAHLAQAANPVDVFLAGMAALHQGQDAVAAALHRQMQVADQLGNVRVGLDQAVAELDRMRGGVADPLDAVDGGHVMQQQREIGDLAVVHQAAVGVDVLPQQHDLADTLLRQQCQLGDDIIQRAADLLAAGIGHDAEGAVLAAALHDRHERLRPLGAWLRQGIEFLDLGEGNVDGGLLLPAHPVQQLRQAVQGLRAEHEVDIGGALLQGFALLTGDAATDTDDEIRPALLQRPPATEFGEHLFLGLLAHGAGVHEQHVGLFGIVGQLETMGGMQYVPHLGGIVFVHLAA